MFLFYRQGHCGAGASVSSSSPRCTLAIEALLISRPAGAPQAGGAGQRRRRWCWLTLSVDPGPGNSLGGLLASLPPSAQGQDVGRL